jgi:hypothetical protein
VSRRKQAYQRLELKSLAVMEALASIKDWTLVEFRPSEAEIGVPFLEMWG